MFCLAVVESIIIEDESGTEDEEMVMTCVATGGKPASTITWVMPHGVEHSVEEEVWTIVSIKNNYEQQSIIKIIVQEEEEFQTVSKLTFTPSAAENEKKVGCQAINDVMDAAVEYETEMNILRELHKKSILEP